MVMYLIYRKEVIDLYIMKWTLIEVIRHRPQLPSQVEVAKLMYRNPDVKQEIHNGSFQ